MKDAVYCLWTEEILGKRAVHGPCGWVLLTVGLLLAAVKLGCGDSGPFLPS